MFLDVPQGTRQHQYQRMHRRTSGLHQSNQPRMNNHLLLSLHLGYPHEVQEYYQYQHLHTLGGLREFHLVCVLHTLNVELDQERFPLQGNTLDLWSGFWLSHPLRTSPKQKMAQALQIHKGDLLMHSNPFRFWVGKTQN